MNNPITALGPKELVWLGATTALASTVTPFAIPLAKIGAGIAGTGLVLGYRNAVRTQQRINEIMMEQLDRAMDPAATHGFDYDY